MCVCVCVRETCFDLVGHPEALQEAKTVTQQVQYIQAYVLHIPVTVTCKHWGSHNAGKLNSCWI